MKICPQCQRRFNENARVCPHDGTPLRAERPAADQARQAGPVNRDLIGRKFFGEYTVVKKLGEGGMGAVYLARQDVIEQTVALKVLHANAAESQEIVQRFYREAKVISMLTHPNIVRVFIFGRSEDNLLYLVMEYVKGRELRDELDRRGRLDELLAIKIMKQSCSALAEAHDLGIIHRDLKPDNILLTEFRGEENFVKILDFGIAKINDPDGGPQQQLTQAGIVYGTPEYISPEQAQALELDARTDIYSMGCILYELITGQTPFSDKNPVTTLTKHVFEKPPTPNQILPGQVAPTMEKIIMKALEKKPEDRYGSAMELFEALVGREREIMAERNLGTKDTYFPGSELTGMYQVSQLQHYLDNAAEPSPAAALNDGGMRAESAKSGTQRLQPGPANSPRQASGTSGQYKLIIGAIAVLALVFIGLLGAIAFLLLK